MTLLLNGEIADTNGAATIAELIQQLNMPPQTVLVEHNGLALHRHEWADRKLSNGDRVEIVRMVAGG